MGLPHFVTKGRGAIDKSLESIITKSLSFVQEGRSDERIGRLYASSVGYCARRGAFQATSREPNVISASGRVYMHIGEKVEDLVVLSLEKEGVLLFTQYALPDIGLNLGGKIDGIVFINGKIRALEIKTCGKLPNIQKPEHRAQALLYEAVTGIPSSVLYLSRNVANYRGELQVIDIQSNPTKDELRNVIYNTALAYYSIRAGVAPSKPVSFTESNCRYCSFKPVCWSHGEPPMPFPDPEQLVKISRKALRKTNELMDPEAVKKRRHGVLKFISKFGNANAKKVLKGTDWNMMLD